MEREDDILHRAIEQVRNDAIPSRPPQEVLDETLTKLAQATERAGTPRARHVDNLRMFGRLTAAAAVLVFAGYAVGRLSTPKLPDMAQLEKAMAQSLAASIEPGVRQKVIEDLSRQWRSTLDASYVALREDLTEQYRSDLVQVAAQTLATSNATTHRLLEELIASINIAQVQNRQWVAAALAELDATRRQDSVQFANALVTLAAATEGEIERTKKDMAGLLAGARDANAD